MSTSPCAMIAFIACWNTGPWVASIGVKLEQEWIQSKQRGHQHRPTVAVLDIRRVHEGVHQQSGCIDKHVPLLALDLFPCVIPGRIDEGPPFSALFTL